MRIKRQFIEESLSVIIVTVFGVSLFVKLFQDWASQFFCTDRKVEG